MASGAIGHAIAGDGHQPGKEGALRIVGRAGNVKGKKYLLDNVFDVRRRKKAVSPPHNLPQQREYLAKKPRICSPVSVLRCSHEIGETSVVLSASTD